MKNKELQDLVAQSAIRRLISSYCDAVANRDARTVSLLFAPDAYARIAHLPPRQSREEIFNGVNNTFSNFEFLQQRCDTGLINVSGSSASARLRIQESNRLKGQQGMNLIYGVYEDQYVRLDEGWRFQRREFDMQFRIVLEGREAELFDEFSPSLHFDV